VLYLGVIGVTLITSSSNSFAATSSSTSYVNPFPAGGTYKILIIGDGYADGLSLGMRSATVKNKKVTLFREVSYGASLLKKNRSNWLKKVDTILQKRVYDIAVVMVGFGDRRSVKVNGKWMNMDKPEWRTEYRKKITTLLRKLAVKKIATYWVGMPIVRGPKTAAGLKIINEVARSQTGSARVKFIDNWLHFANEDGQYTQYGPDVNGKIRLLRPKDGLFFTRAGYEKLGHFVFRFIQKDLREANAERNIPLFGDNSEQDYLLQRHALDDPKNKRRRAALKARNQGKALKSKIKQLSGVGLQRNKYDTAKHSSITIDADKSGTGKAITMQIVRPAIPAAAFSISRRSSNSSSSDGDVNGAEVLNEVMGDSIGLSLSSVSQQILSSKSNRRIPLTQTPYYKLLVRGDALQSKSGRADHFSWIPEAVETKTSDKKTN
jgi:hypothetical protein